MANEKRLIDANDLWHKTFVCDEVAEVRKFIESAPSVDAVVLPSKVRADVWLIRWWNYCRFENLPCPMQRTVLHYEIRADGLYAHFHDGCIHTKYFGETVFLTMEEAKVAITKRDGDGNA